MKDDPKLYEMLVVAKRVEHSIACIEVIKRNNISGSTWDIILSFTKTPSSHAESLSDVKKRTDGYRNVNKSAGSYPRKPFKGKCFMCDNIGHLAKISHVPPCWSSVASVGNGNFAKCCNSQNGTKHLDEVRYADKNDEKELLHCGEIVLQVGQHKGKGPTDEVLINGQCVRMLFDLGAKISLIPKEF